MTAIVFMRHANVVPTPLPIPAVPRRRRSPLIVPLAPAVLPPRAGDRALPRRPRTDRHRAPTLCEPLTQQRQRRPAIENDEWHAKLLRQPGEALALGHAQERRVNDDRPACLQRDASQLTQAGIGAYRALAVVDAAGHTPVRRLQRAQPEQPRAPPVRTHPDRARRP